MSRHIPDFIVHYCRAYPFLSITQRPESEWPDIIKNLDTKNAWGLNRFSDPSYLSKRKAAEEHMRQEFIGLGGVPEISSPIYFFLGRSKEFEGNILNLGYRIQLQDLPATSVSFTYGDSLISVDRDYRSQVGEKYQNELSGKLFLISDLPALHKSIPSDDALHIEAQLWMDPSNLSFQIVEK